MKRISSAISTTSAVASSPCLALSSGARRRRAGAGWVPISYESRSAQRLQRGARAASRRRPPGGSARPRRPGRQTPRRAAGRSARCAARSLAAPDAPSSPRLSVYSAAAAVHAGDVLNCSVAPSTTQQWRCGSPVSAPRRRGSGRASAPTAQSCSGCARPSPARGRRREQPRTARRATPPGRRCGRATPRAPRAAPPRAGRRRSARRAAQEAAAPP